MLLHRFTVAGAIEPYRICTGSASRLLYDLSMGVPRDFITIADAAMKEAFLRGAPQIIDVHVHSAMRGLAGRQDSARGTAAKAWTDSAPAPVDGRAFAAPFSARSAAA